MAPDPDPNTRHHVATCPICEDGLCGVRVYLDDESNVTHGLIVCDECEAIWLQPNVSGVHVYANSQSPLSPVSGQGLYDQSLSRWANRDDVAALGWSAAVKKELDWNPSDNETIDHDE